MVDPEYDELQIGDDPDYDEHQHVYVPFKPEIQKNFGVVQRGKYYLELVLEVYA